ncbi:MAG: DUF6457 domain-containing protein [Candidatus Dormibacteraceae bacterium]
MGEAFLVELVARIERLVSKQEGATRLLPLTDAMSEELLALAGAVAHASERRLAPLSTYLVGLAVAHIVPDSDSEAKAVDLVHQLRLAIEAETHGTQAER